MTTNGNDGIAPGQTKAPRCTTMGRITAVIRLVALLGLLGAGTLDAWPEANAGGTYARYVRDRVQQVQNTLRQPGWSSPATLAPDRD